MQPWGIAYGIPELRSAEWGARSRRLATHIIYTYVAGESTWYYEREEESRNRKRFTPTRISPHTLLIVPCRVSKRRERDRDSAICFIQRRVSGNDKYADIFDRPISSLSDSNIYEYPLTKRKSDDSKRLIVVPRGDGIRSIVESELFAFTSSSPSVQSVSISLLNSRFGISSFFFSILFGSISPSRFACSL